MKDSLLTQLRDTKALEEVEPRDKSILYTKYTGLNTELEKYSEKRRN